MTRQISDPARRRFIAAGGAALLCAMAAPALAAGAPATQVLEGRAFGTFWRVVLPDVLPDDRPAEELRAPVEALLAGIDAEMSPWRRDSLLCRINAAPPGPVAVTAEFALVAGAALRLAEQSGGAFDPSVGPAVARWGFGPIQGGGTSAGWRGFTLDGDRLTKAAAGATLDLCGIAKGRALDRVAALLRARGLTHALIEIGGELLALGRHPSGRRWRVGIEHPLPGAPGLIGQVALENAAVATSGIKANSFSLGARRYSHIVDPQSAMPVTGALASVTVLAPDTMRADGWATALMAAGEARAAEMARRNRLDALLVFDRADGLQMQTTGQFAFGRG